MAGLFPAIHVFNSVEFFGVDARNKSGHDANYFQWSPDEAV